MSKTIHHPARWQETERRILELELLQVRREADAARLEARAAELERMIQQMWLAESPRDPAGSQPKSSSAVAKTNKSPSPRVRGQPAKAKRVTARAAETKPAPPAIKLDTDTDKARRSVTRRLPLLAVPPKRNVQHGDSASAKPVRRFRRRTRSRPITNQRVNRDRVRIRFIPSLFSRAAGSRQRRAIIVSAIAHLFLLVLLALVGLNLQKPKDQVQFSASVSSTEATPIETLSFQTTEPSNEPEPEQESDPEYDLNPIGEMVLSDSGVDAASPPQASSLSALSQSTAAKVETLQSSSAAQPVEFCGVEGGGNHFVYLVDSSKSMGQAFQMARRELLRSISALTPEQRFYVIFFDANSDYMRIANQTVDEKSSVNATVENKEALQRWAMSITMDDGRAPYDPLRFALDLNPDVIFLLSDGEFPAGVEELLQQDNQIANLFGDRQRRSIVHTIGYHSRSGEERMRRIATQNGGQYRHIPKP